ncbi:FimV/HubP family polar landmark protein [Isoalcanivorax indicus]|uniref:FimV/HubP family polar landmark protein n=1 Tax=Isoalcanivorax indicus TaxID=2202653 RepID=UPI000DB98477|nr:FimV/HubP family polar landmark protein [Isoalcanivorax indicus]
MLRRLGIGFTAVALFLPGLASALGVGDYTLNSYLNQPLDMKITLRDTGDLNQEQLLVSLASDRDFAVAGVDRQSMHSELRFEVNLSEDGSGVVRVTTRQPVREPYLNFLVEYLWPTGRMLREYTVLLDPPSYAADRRSSPQAPAATAPPARPDPAPQPRPQPRPETAPERDTPRVAAPATPRPATREPATTRTHTVRGSDTMWRIARDNRPNDSVSVQQMMMVIQEMNPDAFINNNVNLVREGAVLRLPSEEEARRLSTREALASVAEQNRQWRALLEARGIQQPGRQQLDGTPRTRDTDVATTRPDQGRVTLVAPDTEGSGAGTGAGSARAGDGAALENELLQRDEQLDQMRRENRELADRLRDLEDQVNTGEDILRLRNDQITRLQEELRRLREERGIDADEDDSLLAPVPALIGADEADDEERSEDATESEARITDADDATREDEDDEAVAVAPATPAERERPTTPPQTAPPTPPQPSLMDNLLGNPLVLAGAALLLLLLVLLAVLQRRRQHAAAGADDDAEMEAFGDDDDFLPDLSASDDEDPFADSDDGADAAPAAGRQDPLEQVEVFMAYGQYPQATAHLRNAISQEPGRIDLKKRLLDVLVESQDSAAFEQEATKLGGLNGDLDKHIAALRPRLGGGDTAADDDLSFDDLAMDLTAQPAPRNERPSVDSADDDILTLDDSADDAQDDEILELEDSLDDFGDFDLDVPSEPAPEAPRTPAAASNKYSINDSDEESLSDEEISASLKADPVLELDTGAGLLDDAGGDMDFGELKLDDVSDEFSGVTTETASVDEDDLDLSLDDLTLDEPAPRPAADDSLSLDMPELEDISLEDVDLDDSGLNDEISLDDIELEPVASRADDLDDILSLDDTPEPAPPAASTPAVEAPRPAAPAPAVRLSEDAGLGDDDDFDFLGETDENATKLDLARAYIDMGDTDGARDILNEVVAEGNDQQQSEARELLAQVG